MDCKTGQMLGCSAKPESFILQLIFHESLKPFANSRLPYPSTQPPTFPSPRSNSMGNKTRSVLSLILLAGAALACGPVYGQHGDDRDNDRSPAVFVMANAANRNEVISYQRNADGTLTEERHFSTGGRGSGGNNDPLESQGSLTLTQDHSHLLAVNAGSGDISFFRIHGSDLDLRDRVSSGCSDRMPSPCTATLSMSSTVVGAAALTAFSCIMTNLLPLKTLFASSAPIPRARHPWHSAPMDNSSR